MKPVLVIGGEPREHQMAQLRAAFGDAEIIWARRDRDRARLIGVPDMSRVGLLLLFTRAISHNHCNTVTAEARRHGVPVVRLASGGFSPQTVRLAVADQAGDYPMPEITETRPLSLVEIVHCFRGPERTMPTATETRTLRALAEAGLSAEDSLAATGRGSGVGSKAAKAKVQVAQALGVSRAHVGHVARRISTNLDLLDTAGDSEAPAQESAVATETPSESPQQPGPGRDVERRIRAGFLIPEQLRFADDGAPQAHAPQDLAELEQVAEMERKEHLAKIAELETEIGGMRARESDARAEVERLRGDLQKAAETIWARRDRVDRDEASDPAESRGAHPEKPPQINPALIPVVLDLAVSGNTGTAKEEWAAIPLDERIAVLLRAVAVLRALQ